MSAPGMGMVACFDNSRRQQSGPLLAIKNRVYEFATTILTVGVALMTLASDVDAQINFLNYFETRLGKDPNDPFPNVPDNLLTHYNQFNLDYYRDNLQLGFRFETYVPSHDPSLEFSQFTRRYAGWNSEHINALLGNYEALFGRGVVLRAFALDGIVREEVGTPQFGDSRDLDGVRFRLHGPRYAATFLSGKPRRADDPPTSDRDGLVTGGEASVVLVHGVRVGGEYLRLDTQRPGPGSTIEVKGGFAAVNFDRWLRHRGFREVSLGSYVEYARAAGLALPPAASSPNVNPDEGRALYFAQNLSTKLPGLRLGVSWEYKDYQNFELGVNEPPSLVREHQYILLNRTTHVLQANQEEGTQFESRLNFLNLLDLTLNWSRAENRGSRQFKEFYAELATHYRRATWSVFSRAFQDPVENLYDSDTAGTYASLPMRGPHSIELEYEQMTGVRRSGASELAFKDNYASVSYAWAGYFSLSVIRQTTDDPREAEDPITGEIERRYFDSLSGSLRIGNHHELLGFWGRRRSGLQCTAGSCYLVRAFDGVILQLLSRF